MEWLWLTGCCSQLLGEDFLTIFRGWHHIGSRAAGLLFSCFTSSPPSTSSQLRSNSQTSAHRRLSAAVHSTQKNLKTRKTRPFIDSLVEGSLKTAPYAITTAAILTAHARVSIARLSQSLATDLSAYSSLPGTRHPLLFQHLKTNVRGHFSLSFPDPATRAYPLA